MSAAPARARARSAASRGTRSRTRTPRRFALPALAALLLLAATLSLGWGAVFVPPDQVIAALLSPDADAAFIIRTYRLPRVLCALLAGAVLAVAGALLQAALRNPLASPDVIGVNKGAGLGAVLVIMVVPTATWLLPVAAVAGALAAVGVLFSVVDRRRGSAIVALSGIAVGAVFQAITMLIVVASPGDANRSMIWLAGSLYGSTIAQAIGLAIAATVLLPAVVRAARDIDLMRLSDESLTTLGRDPRRMRIAWVVLAALLAASAVAVVGTIGFLGLLAPHLAASLVGHRPRALVPTAALAGALLLVCADLAGRVVATPSEIPAGIVVSIIGVPYLLSVLWKGAHVR